MKSKIDRRIEPIFEPPSLTAMPTRVIFHDAWGGVEQTFDTNDLNGMPGDLAAALVRAFHTHTLGGAVSTRDARWRVLRVLAEFLRDQPDAGSARDIDDARLRRFVSWMAERPNSKCGQSTLARDVSLLRPLIERASRDDPALFGGPRSIPAYLFPYSHQEGESRRRLSSKDMKAILAACYREIDEAWAMFQHGQAVVAGPEPARRNGREIGKDRLIWLHHRAGEGIAANLRQMEKHGLSVGGLEHCGLQRGFARYFHLMPETLAPFYIALAIQTAANPEPLRLIRRDCLVPHPLDEHRVLIEWIKPKTGLQVQRMQRRSFDRRRPKSAPRLVEMLAAMTAPLLAHVPVKDRDRLFLIRRLGLSRTRPYSHPAGIISEQGLNYAMAGFITRSNERIAAWNTNHPERPQALVPDFTSSLFRGSVATAHYEASGGDILASKAVLNHQSVATTDRYVSGPAVEKIERDTIARLQRLMLAWVMPVNPQNGDIGEMPMATALFGNDCLAPATKDGRVCPKLGGCLACPGLVVPLDAEHLARILQARAHLQEARDRIDSQRWALFYAPSLGVLTDDLLPAFPTELMAQAQQIAAALPPLPELE